MTEEALKEKLDSIEKRLQQLEHQESVASGGDPEFFGQQYQLDALERQVKTLILVLKERLPWFDQTFCECHTLLENAVQQDDAQIEAALDAE